MTKSTLKESPGQFRELIYQIPLDQRKRMVKNKAYREGWLDSTMFWKRQRSIRDRIIAIGESLARMSPKIAQAVVGVTPLAPFSNLIGEAVEKIVQAAL